MQAAPALTDLEQIRRDIESNEKAFREVVTGLTGDQLNWRPANGKSWSVLQCVDHLALSNRAYLEAIAPAVRKAKAAELSRRGPIHPSAAGAVFLKKIEPPVTSKLNAPKTIIPSPVLDRVEVLDRFARTHEQIRHLLREAADLDFNRIKFRNPLLPLLRVRAGTGLLIMAAHERRHLWQAQRVRSELEIR